MKNIFSVLGGIVAGVIVVSACSDNAVEKTSPTEFTGNQTVYALQAASEYPVSGTATVKERKDGTSTILISLKGISDNDQHPVHLHMGDISTDKAAVAALLAPVQGSDGESTTNLSILADESSVKYADIVKLNACLKIHLGSTGSAADVILAAGNIGTASSMASGRSAVAVCSGVSSK